MRRLNVGAGPDRHPLWESLDMAAYQAPMTPARLEAERRGFTVAASSEPDHWVDLVHEKVPASDCSFDSIVASHSLTQIEYHAIGRVLRELHRVLVHGGTLRVIDRDATKAIDAWMHGRVSHFPIDDDTERTLDGKFCAYLTWYSAARCVWTAEAFADQLHRAGFPVVAHVTPQHTRGYDPEIVRWDRREGESFFIEAVRP